jgi:hypothetical protein
LQEGAAEKQALDKFCGFEFLSHLCYGFITLKRRLSHPLRMWLFAEPKKIREDFN